MENLEGIILLGAIVFFTAVTVLILYRNRNYLTYTVSLTNTLFGIAISCFCITHFTNILWVRGIGYFFFIIAPIGWIASGHIINFGTLGLKDREFLLPALFQFVYGLFISVTYLSGYQDFVTVNGDLGVVVGCLITDYFYIRVYRQVPEEHLKLGFFIFGIALGILGLSGNAFYFYLSGGQHLIIRQLFPTIGIIFTLIAFSSLPIKFITSFNAKILSTLQSSP